MDDVRKGLGERIKHYREMKNLSQPALASAMKVDAQSVYRWEKGRSWPEYDKLIAIARHLSVEPDQLFETIGKDAPTKTETTSDLLVALFQEALKLDHDALALVLESVRIRVANGQGKPVRGIKDNK